jgi:hypothetical protein
MGHMRIRGRILRRVFAAAVALLAWASPARAQPNDAAATTFVAHYAPTVPGDVRAAVDFAMQIWSARVESSVPIEVDVDWGGGLPSNVTASTEPVGYEPVAVGSLQPVALANALAGRDLAPGVSDIHLLLGAGVRWYTGIDGAAPATATDMVTLALHELAHGLGFANSFRLASNGLAWGRDGVAVGLDAHEFDNATGALVNAPTPVELLSSATSRRVVWRGDARDSHGRAPVMYAPAQFEPGSSLSHFDDDAYPPGDPAALITTLVRPGEDTHHIGPPPLGVLHDLGWTVHAESATAASAAPPSPRPVTPTAPVVAAAPTAPPPVLPAKAASHHARMAGDLGRTGMTGLGTAFPMLLAALGWRLRRNLS